MAKYIKWFLVILLLPVLLLVLIIIGNTVLNSFYLWKFEKQLYNYPLPSGAKILKKNSNIGVLMGNGNHCDFIAYVELETSKSILDIEEHYKNMTILPALSNRAQQGFIIEPVSQGVIKVKIWDAPNSSNFDLRCT